MDMLAALRLQIEWGADEPLGEAPVNRLAAPAVPLGLGTPQPPRPPPKLAAVAQAQAASEAAHTIQALRQALAAFTGCNLAATATSLVFSDGDGQSSLVVVGDVPGDEEDRTGRPFSGAAGQLLDRMFASINVSRADMTLIYVVPWRPPGGRPPSDPEVQTCLPFLWRHLTLLRPRVVVAFGTIPTRALSLRDESIRKLRGRQQVLSIPGLPAPIPMHPMLQPTYLLQSPAAKRDAWTDLLALRRTLDNL